MIDGIKEITTLIDNPVLSAVVVILALGFAFYKSFQLIKRENFTLHKDRLGLIKDFIESLSSTNHHDRVVSEELFQALWGSGRIRYDEILFLMKLNSPKYLISLYIKAKNYVEIDNNEIKVLTKYNRHISGLEKEEKKVERSYYLFAFVFSLVLSTSMFLNRPDSWTDFLILILFLLICLIGMVFALFEVSKIYAAQRIIQDWKK